MEYFENCSQQQVDSALEKINNLFLNCAKAILEYEQKNVRNSQNSSN